MKKIWFAIFVVISVGIYFQQDASEKNKEKTQIKNHKVKKENKITQQDPIVKAELVAIKKTNQTINIQQSTPVSPLGEDFVPFDEKGNRYITQINQVGKHLVYHGDLLIGDVKDIEKIKKQKVITQAKPQKWPNGKIPFILDEGLSNANEVLEAIEYLQDHTKIKFVPRENEKNYVHFTFGEMDCYSYAGMIGGKQEIYLTPQCQIKEILHELMHSLGFLHEQNREDRDQYVQVLWKNIEEINHTQFKKIPNHFLGIKARPFDFDSIMMYSSFSFSLSPSEPTLLTKDGDIIPATRNLLSDEDLKRINLAYP